LIARLVAGRFILGVIPASLRCDGPKQWVGTSKSWGYIAGTGGKCHDTAKSVEYGAKYGEGDVIGVCIDFDAGGTLSFWKNGVDQGIAYTGLSGNLAIAASLTGTGSSLTFVEYAILPSLNASASASLSASASASASAAAASSAASASSAALPASATATISGAAAAPSAQHDGWDAVCKSVNLVVDGGVVSNNGSNDKWQSVRALRPMPSYGKAVCGCNPPSFPPSFH
jgi:hypothetical protein